MSEKRRDSKNRILRTGESQEADGRYKYRYIDANGKRKTVYSWRLVATDSIPAGKKDNAPLRDQEKAINKDLDDMIIPDGGGLTVLQLVKKYIATKTGVKHTTRAGYGTVINLLEKDPFGAKRIDKVRLSDAKKWLIRLQQVDKKSFSAIHSIRGVVRPAFQMAVDDDILRKNPFGFQLATVLVNDAVTREAITRKQERTFLEFIKNDAHYCKYYDGMYILFKTGMRISDDDDKIRLNQRKPSKYKGLSRFGPEKNLQRINKFMKERPIFYKNLIQMKENFRFYLRCFYCITKVVILQFNSENRTELARNG
jgi:hypothetical protein